MKKIGIFILLLICCNISQSFLGFSRAVIIHPISDTCDVDLPRNFRTTLYPVPIQGNKSLNLQGLQDLRMSGSGQFSKKAFIAMMKFLPVSSEKLIILDLRQESHGLINGQPVSWTDGEHNYANIHKTKAEIESDEYARLKLAGQAKFIVINSLSKPLRLVVEEIQTEKELVTSFGATYIRLPVTDHNAPLDEMIDQFIELVKNLQPDQWIHMHCRAGKGRTTTFLTLLDIAKNARYLSLKEILARQHFIGGVDLNAVKKNPNKERTRAAITRLEFIQNFYLYCQQVPDFKISWSDWRVSSQFLVDE